MEQKIGRLYPGAPLEKDDLEQRLEEKLNDLNGLNNHINSNEETIIYFKDKNHRSKKNCKFYKTLNTIIESVDSIVIIGATSTSTTLSVTGVGLFVLPFFGGIACTLSIANKVLNKLILNIYNK